MSLQKLRDWLNQEFENYHDLISVAVLAILADLGYGILNLSAIQPYAKAMAWTTHIGSIYAAFMVAEALSRSPIGSLSDLVGRRFVYIGAALMGAGVAFVWTIPHQLWMIMIVQVFGGVVFAGFYTTTLVAMSGAVGSERRTGAMGLFVVVFLGGMSLGPVAGGYANDITGSLLASFYAASIFFLLAAMLAHFIFPRRDHDHEQKAGQGEDTSRPVGVKPLLAETWLGIRSIPDYMLIAFTMYFPLGMIIPISKLFAMSELGMSEATYGLVFLVGAVLLAGVSLVSARLTSRWGRTRFVQVGLAVSGISMFGVALAHVTWGVVISAGFVGLGLIMSLPAWLALVTDLASPETRGAVIGALGLGQGLGLIGGVVVGGYLYTSAPIDVFGVRLGAHYTPFLGSAIGLTVSAILAAKYVKPEPERRISW